MPALMSSRWVESFLTRVLKKFEEMNFRPGLPHESKVSRKALGGKLT